jgi:ferrous iron transport protein B
LRFALIGQPNCGKSTLFNQVAGYKAETGNFSGTSVTFIESKVRLMGGVITLVDLPGTFTLEGTNPAERESLKYLASNQVDVIINVVDSTHLAQGLELTMELLALNRPMVVALNMLDEAANLGMKVDGPGLQETLGVPVLPLIASKGRGVQGLFLRALEAAGKENTSHSLDPSLSDPLARHRMAENLGAQYVKLGEGKPSWRQRVDDVLLHPFWGYIALLVVLFLFFLGVYGFGSAIERPMLALFNQLSNRVSALMIADSVWQGLVVGVIQGFSGGVAIVLPYLVPFLLGLGLLEDVGYLPRIAFLMDGLMHRLGLHGKAIVPFILGYGCNVPAVMSTRILEDRQSWCHVQPASRLFSG